MAALDSAIDGLLAVVRQIIDFETSRFREPTIGEDGMPDWCRHFHETTRAGIDSDDYGQREDLRERFNLALFAIEETAGVWDVQDLRKRLRKIANAIEGLPGWGGGASDQRRGFQTTLTSLAESKMYDGERLKPGDATKLLENRVQAVTDAVELLTPVSRKATPQDAVPELAPTVVVLERVEPDPNRISYGVDCRCVNWYGTVYNFAPIPAACVRILIEHCKHGVPDVGEKTILTNEWVETSQTRLASVFDNGKHPAWGTMITPGATKGTFRIATREADS